MEVYFSIVFGLPWETVWDLCSRNLYFMTAKDAPIRQFYVVHLKYSYDWLHLSNIA
jgi:hypothetical protein